MALMVPIAGGAKTITLQALPANIANTGGVVTLIALVRDSLGQPAPDVKVNFTTTVGTLASKGGFKKTNGGGEATDTLTVLGSDLTNQTSITVTATAAAADGSLQIATAMVSVVNPNAATAVSVSASPGQVTSGSGTTNITLTAFVLNSQGQEIKGALVIFSTTFGTIKQPSQTTDLMTAKATTTLTVTSVPASTPGITVTAQSPGVGGVLVNGTVTIAVVSP
jgi:adhesin/invasin